MNETIPPCQGVKGNTLWIVGAGPGNGSLLTGQAVEALMNAGKVFAAKRLAHLAGNGVLPLEPIGEALEQIEKDLKEEDIAVLVSGDPTMFSLTRIIRRKLTDAKIIVVPGIGASDALYAALGESRENSTNISVHGREFDSSYMVAAVRHNELCTIWLDAANNAAKICSALNEYGLGGVDVAVGKDLTQPAWQIIRGSAREFIDSALGDNAIMRVRNHEARPMPCVPVLEDEDFARGDVPMTKAHVRKLVACELALERDSVMWDAGAGTGSVAVQCALLAPYGKVYAVERNLDGIELIHKNSRALGAANVIAVKGDMPEALQGLPKPTHVFIGGSGGALGEIVERVLSFGPGIKVVVTAVTIETAHGARALLKSGDFKNYKCMQVQASIEGRAGIFAAQNPIYILSAVTCKTNGGGD